MQLLKRSLITLAGLVSLIALPAMAQANLLSFASPAYDARHGGRQVTIEELLIEPGAHYRSDTAYNKAREIIGGNMGITLTDDDFKKILQSDRVSVVNCADVFTEKFTLAAIDSAGNAYWAKPRSCDPGERIVMLDGVPVMSLACLNPIKLPEMDCLCGTVYYEWRKEHPKG